MEELEISGKRYISAKRIAKENKYHPDYMGQLIRAGKVTGTKVGRAWYVEEASLMDYLGKEGPTRTSPALAPVVDVVEAVAPRQPEFVPVGFGGRVAPTQNPLQTPVSLVRPQQYKPEVFSQRPIVEQPFTPARQPEPITVEKVFIPSTQPRYHTVPVKKPSVTYISDDSPLFPQIQKRSKEVETPVAHVAIKEISAPVYEPVDEPLQQPIPKKKRSKLKTGLAIFSLTTVAGIVFTLAFFGSVGINSTIVAEQGKPATVLFSQEKTFCFIFNTCQTGENQN